VCSTNERNKAHKRASRQNRAEETKENEAGTGTANKRISKKGKRLNVTARPKEVTPRCKWPLASDCGQRTAASSNWWRESKSDNFRNSTQSGSTFWEFIWGMVGFSLFQTVIRNASVCHGVDWLDRKASIRFTSESTSGFLGPSLLAVIFWGKGLRKGDFSQKKALLQHRQREDSHF
jgi:hypothetical protein